MIKIVFFLNCFYCLIDFIVFLSLLTAKMRVVNGISQPNSLNQIDQEDNREADEPLVGRLRPRARRQQGPRPAQHHAERAGRSASGRQGQAAARIRRGERSVVRHRHRVPSGASRPTRAHGRGVRAISNLKYLFQERASRASTLLLLLAYYLSLYSHSFI